MIIENTKFRGMKIIRPRVFEDQRGYFFESWNPLMAAESGIDREFVQDNQSGSQKGVLRGLHFQLPPYEQGKLVRVVRGSVFDVAVDLRQNEPTYKQYFGMVLSAADHSMLYIPPGFAHGFLSLEDKTIFSYRCTAIYHGPSERSIRWNDPELGIDWGTDKPLLSDKDRQAPLFSELPAGLF